MNEDTSLAAVIMNIPQISLIGKNKIIPVKFTVNDSNSLKDYRLRIKIDKQPGNTFHKSSVSYKQHGKKQTFSSSREITLDQLMKPGTTKECVFDFTLIPSKHAPQVSLSFELLSPKQENPASIIVTWSISEISVQLKKVGDEHFIEVQSYGNPSLDEWMLQIIPLHQVNKKDNQIVFDVENLTSPTAAKLKELLPGTTQLVQGKLYSIKIKVLHSQESRFIVIPIKINQKAGNKTALSPDQLRFIAHSSAYEDGFMDGMDTKLGFASSEFLLGVITIGIGIGFVVSPVPIIGPVLIVTGIIMMIDASLYM